LEPVRSSGDREILKGGPRLHLEVNLRVTELEVAGDMQEPLYIKVVVDRVPRRKGDVRVIIVSLPDYGICSNNGILEIADVLIGRQEVAS